MQFWSQLQSLMERHGRAVAVTVAATAGSVPRDAGARLIVSPGGGFRGTIGGGTLEWQALARAQAMLDGGREVEVRDYALGPELGQCCGGRVTLLFELFDEKRLEEVRAFKDREAAGAFSTEGRVADGGVERRVKDHGEPSWRDGVLVERFGERPRPVLLCGAGHVGRAVVLALAPLPFHVRWLDPRPDAFPGAAPANVTAEAADPAAAVAASQDEGAFVLVMTHSHALDLAVVDAALRSGRFPYVGLIGSATKKARFVKRLEEAGLAAEQVENLMCPIGLGGIKSKVPAVIAASVAADLLMRDEALRATAAGREGEVRKAEREKRSMRGTT